MPANDPLPCVWSRRSLLMALAVGSASVLSGCRLRLEGDSPTPKVLPPRQPMPDEQALLLAHRDAQRLRELTAGMGTAANQLTNLLATVHQRQADVLETLLRSGGVPPAEIMASSTATATATATATPISAPPTTARPAGNAGITAPASSPLAELVAAEAQALAPDALSDLAKISRDRVALLGSMTAQRAAAVRLLGGSLPFTDTPSGPAGKVAAAQLEAIRAAVYGFEVVTAQTDAGHRKEAAGTLEALRTRSSQLRLLAGSEGGPAPLGYALPFPVSTPEAALRLARHLMTALLQAIASQLPAVTADAVGLTGTVQVLTEVCVQAVAWRVPLTAFPGLTSR